jgi:hypothetical protein
MAATQERAMAKPQIVAMLFTGGNIVEKTASKHGHLKCPEAKHG